MYRGTTINADGIEYCNKCLFPASQCNCEIMKDMESQKVNIDSAIMHISSAEAILERIIDTGYSRDAAYMIKSCLVQAKAVLVPNTDEIPY